MPLINFQPNPKIPPIGFFDPISVDPKDMMTDVEYLLGILKKLNSMIAQLNANTAFIEEYQGKIEEIEAEVENLRKEMAQFEEEVDRTITLEFAQIRIELQGMINSTLVQAKAYTDTIAAGLNQRIDEISIGEITLFDPTTGIESPLQVVIDNIYDAGRSDALTATEYDALDLTATAYDAYDLTATEYDRNAKSLLV